MRSKEQARHKTRPSTLSADQRRGRDGTLTREHPVLQMQKSMGNQSTLRFIRDSILASHDYFKGAATNPLAGGSELAERADRSFLELSSPAPVTLSRMPDTRVSGQTNGGCACEKHSGSNPCAECAQKPDLATSESKTADTTGPKLSISQPGDRHEREAAQVADRVMRMPSTHPPAIAAAGSLTSEAALQRKCKECEEEEEQKKKLNRKETGAAPGMAPPIVHEALRAAGEPLDSRTQSFMQSRFGYDFSPVRVHTGGVATESARAVNARAYTVGQDVVFGSGQFAPQTRDGRKLLAHELAHVVQQSRIPAGGGPSSLGRMLMRSTITDSYITFNTAPKFLTDDYTVGDTAVQLLRQTPSYKTLRDDILKAFNKVYGGAVHTSVTQFENVGKEKLCGNDAAGCCQNCDENCGRLGILAPPEFFTYAELRSGGMEGLITPQGFAVTESRSTEVATASIMYHELLHLWFYQFLCLFKKQNDLIHPSGHNGEYDPLFATMWAKAHQEIEAAYKSWKKAAAATPTPVPTQTPTLPKTIDDLGKEHDRKSGPRGEFRFEAGGGGLTEYRPQAVGGNLFHPIIWGDLGYQFPAESSSRFRWRLTAGGFLAPGEALGGLRAGAGLRILQTENFQERPVENPFYFDFDAGVLYRIDERPGGISSGGVSGGVGFGKMWQLGAVKLEVGANADYLYQWQLENPHAIVFGGHGALHF